MLKFSVKTPSLNNNPEVQVPIGAFSLQNMTFLVAALLTNIKNNY